MKEVCSSGTLLYFYQTTGCHIPEDSNFKKRKFIYTPDFWHLTLQICSYEMP